MKKLSPSLLLIPFLIISFSCSSHDGIVNPFSNKTLTPLDKNVALTSNLFGINLLKDINNSEADSNIFLSPLSISSALGMTLNGANGKTYTQMLNTLQLSGNSQAQVNQAYMNLKNILTTADPTVTFTDANSIWCRQSVSFEQNFLGVNNKYFNAYIQSLDFTNPASPGIINNWVSENTNGKITQIVGKIIPPEVVMYLINAIYFKAVWEYKFDTSFTTLRPFYLQNGSVVQCKMMNQLNNFNYYAGLDYQALEIPYGNGNFNMLIILPNNSVDVNQLLSSVNGTMLNQINAGMTQAQKINLYLPRFQVNYNISLMKSLIDLGMVDAFDPFSADFSNICKTLKLYITDVIHKTYVKVDEEGTEAAAVTVVSIGAQFVIENPVFSVDHPFIFLITEKNSGAIIFAGKVVNPVN
jgi:serpin B